MIEGAIEHAPHNMPPISWKHFVYVGYTVCSSRKLFKSNVSIAFPLMPNRAVHMKYSQTVNIHMICYRTRHLVSDISIPFVLLVFIKNLFYKHKSFDMDSIKVSKGAKIRNRYNQIPHMTQDTTVYTTYDINN